MFDGMPEVVTNVYLSSANHVLGLVQGGDLPKVEVEPTSSSAASVAAVDRAIRFAEIMGDVTGSAPVAAARSRYRRT